MQNTRIYTQRHWFFFELFENHLLVLKDKFVYII